MPISYPKPDLHSINAHTKFGENPLTFTQLSSRKENTDILTSGLGATSTLIQNFKILGAVIPKKSLKKNFIGEKEKWTNMGNDMHEDADSVLHNTSHTQYL